MPQGNEPLINELRERSAGSAYTPELDTRAQPVEALLPEALLRRTPLQLPEVSEPGLVRHYTRLSQRNFCVDANFYPLGSCTMKYNPRVSEKLARLRGFQLVHPYQSEETVQGVLQILHEAERCLAAVTGMDAVSLQPAAGAHGELTGILLIAAYHRDRGENRRKVLIPDSAHGTNPASCALCGYEVETIRSNSDGQIDLDQLRAKLDSSVAALMVTNPNTLGIFEERIVEIADAVHKAGAQLYMDGANLNALVGIARPGDFGVDVVHLNLHKTFATPHGSGGPGAGPVAVKAHLEQYLPVPIVRAEGSRYVLDYDLPKSVGKVRCFYGNCPVILRAYVYLRLLGWEGLRTAAENAVLNANYLLSKVRQLGLPYEGPRLHEFVLSLESLRPFGVKAYDVAKRLLDLGFHPPTMNFPLIVKEALMIEPTETESKATLDAFAEALLRVVEEARTSPDLLKTAPHHLPVRRLDEVKAARALRLRW